jgi:hypothetical protein
LPGDIRDKAFARAGKRVTDMARTRYIKRAAPRLKLAQKVIRDKTTARFNAGGNTSDVVVRSGWIPLAKLGARQTGKGVTVNLRGSYRSAFLAGMASGHKGVMMREGAARLPIRELFGPNPAHDITNNDAVYLSLLAEVIDEALAPRVLHEIDRLLPG